MSPWSSSSRTTENVFFVWRRWRTHKIVTNRWELAPTLTCNPIVCCISTLRRLPHGETPWQTINLRLSATEGLLSLHEKRRLRYGTRWWAIHERPWQRKETTQTAPVTASKAARICFYQHLKVLIEDKHRQPTYRGKNRQVFETHEGNPGNINNSNDSRGHFH